MLETIAFLVLAVVAITNFLRYQEMKQRQEVVVAMLKELKRKASKK